MTARLATALGMLFLVAVAGGPPGAALAQESVFNLTGFGTPGSGESMAARGTGGAETALEGEIFSLDNPARMARFDRAGLYLSLLGQRTEAESATATGEFDDVVFPTGQIVFPAWGGLVLGIGYAQVLDFDARVESVVEFEGDTLDVDLESEGALSILAPGAAWRASERTSVGVTLDIYLGSREVARGVRLQESGALATSDTLARDFRGAGLALGVEQRIGSRAQVAAAWRFRPSVESEITRSTGEGIVGRRTEFSLPDELLLEAAGRLPGSLVAGAAVRWSGWSDAEGEGMDPGGTEDLLDLGGGLEWRPESRTAFLFGPAAPLRLGARWRRLPSVVEDEPVTEWSLAFGHGRSFGTRSRFDAVVEYGQRGALEDHGVVERFVRVGLGVSAFEQWERID